MSFYDFTVNTIDLKPQPLGAYKGRVLLVVNTASECGNTPQYAGLEKLHEELKDRGVESEAQILLGDRNKATEMLAKAVDAEPEQPALYPRLIELLQQSGAADEAGSRLLTSSSNRISSGDNRTSTDFRLSSSCAGVRAPMMTLVTASRASSHAMATCAMLAP